MTGEKDCEGELQAKGFRIKLVRSLPREITLNFLEPTPAPKPNRAFQFLTSGSGAVLLTIILGSLFVGPWVEGRSKRLDFQRQVLAAYLEDGLARRQSHIVASRTAITEALYLVGETTSACSRWIQFHGPDFEHVYNDQRAQEAQAINRVLHTWESKRRHYAYLVEEYHGESAAVNWGTLENLVEAYIARTKLVRDVDFKSQEYVEKLAAQQGVTTDKVKFNSLVLPHDKLRVKIRDAVGSFVANLPRGDEQGIDLWIRAEHLEGLQDLISSWDSSVGK